ncbi:MAG: tRNA (guanosine(37)-N1)-methyltransferase TrmD [Campylobacter sp.]|nr:tRNA (guanosine(37)-N1)-methyltransferase TrmD [Campylobacter sp.]
MKFTYITLFENLIKFYYSDSILKRAVDNSLIEFECVNPRDFSDDKHKKVDEYMIGGGAGLLMQTKPIAKAVNSLKNKPYIIYATPAGKLFSQNDAKRLAKKSHICFICGRYEGIDERIVEKYVNEVFCIGDFVLTGGELPSLCMSDAIARNIKSVLGNSASLEEESFEENLLEAPSFTKPNFYEDLTFPLELLKGNHAKIKALKNSMAKYKTRYFRPDLYLKFKSPIKRNKNDK